jgi:hypothetical protein
MKKCADGQCRQCCGVEHCPGGGTCVQGVCQSEPECPLDCGWATCADMGGQAICVECDPAYDECPARGAGCHCSPASFFCEDAAGEHCTVEVPTCAAICSSDADCPPDASGKALSCYTAGPTGGFCYDPAGACDASSSCCGAGQSCLDLLSLFPGALPSPPLGTSRTGFCSCDDTHPCLGGQPCLDLSGPIALLAQKFGMPEVPFAPRACGDPLTPLLDTP